jgi:hypothetical protein
MATYDDQMLGIWGRYKEEVSSDPADLKEIGAWARTKKLWAPRPIDIDASFARDMAEALRAQVRVDKDGRRYRAFIPAKTKGKDGLPLFRWADIDEAPRSHVEKGVQYERQQIVSDCYALAMKIDHYNAAHPTEEPIQTVFEFGDDIEELKIANGIKKGDAEAA